MPRDFPRFVVWMDHHPHEPPTDGIPPWVRETFTVHWTTNATLLAPFLKRSPWLLALADDLELGEPHVMVDGHGLAPTDIATLAALDGAVPSVTTRARNGDGSLTVGITESSAPHRSSGEAA